MHDDSTHEHLILLPHGHRWQAPLALALAELATGRAAAAGGNDGRARVCARRAVGAFLQGIAGDLTFPPGTHAMANLQRLADEPSLPEAVRTAAALLLRGSRAAAAGQPAADDPIGEARTIIDWFLRHAPPPSDLPPSAANP